MKWSGAIAVATVLIVACGHMQATPQLKQAQAAYEKAAQGPAAQYSPAQLADAKKSLDEASASLESGDRNLVDDKATLAASKIALADSVGRTNQAAAERDATLKDLELARERQARAAAEAQLAENRKELEQHARVQDTARGTVITLSGQVLFKSGKADLLPEAQEHLSKVATFLKSSQRPVVVEGYTDSHGSPKKNQALSEQRARAVSDFLASQGVPADRIQTVGKGESSPVASNKDASGRAQNRRVEIVLQQAPATAGSPPPATESGQGGSAEPGSEQGTTTPPPAGQPEAPVSPPTHPR
jgi:outer membrane protein OmpA-like peptidoglycan-associated protein